MNTLSRRTLLRSGVSSLAALGAVAAVSACTTTTSGGDTTYSINVTKLLSIISSIESGLTQLVNSSTVTTVIGTSNATKITTAITNISKVTAEVAADAASTVTLTVAENWVATAESATEAALVILQDFQSALPSNVNTIVQAIATLLPVLESLIGAVTAPAASVMLSAAEAQAVIAAGL